MLWLLSVSRLGLADEAGIKTVLDHAAEDVVDHLVGLGDDTDLPAMISDETDDGIGGDIGLAGSRRPLDGKVAAVQAQERVNDCRDCILTLSWSELSPVFQP